MKPCTNSMCDICPGNGTYEHDAVGSVIKKQTAFATQIPVYGESIEKHQIGWAEIQQDGSVIIAIQPGEIGKTLDVRFVEQIDGFFVSFQYRKVKPGMIQAIPRD
jgi:hypothetical protein